jgi:hypothetical protein
MKEILDLMEIVKPLNEKKLEFFNSNKLNYLDKFYFGIIEGKIETDEEAANYLYGSESSDKKYLMLKSRLEDKLIEVIYHFDSKIDNNPILEAEENCIKKYIIAKKLKNKNNIKFSIKLFEEALDIAEKFQLNSLKVEILNQLNEFTFGKTQKKLKVLSENFLSYLEVHNAEVKSNILYKELLDLINNNELDIKKNNNLIQQISDFKDKYDSFKLNSTYYEFQINSSFYFNNFNAVIEYSKAFLDYLKKHPKLITDKLLQDHYLIKLETYLKIKDYESVIRVCKRELELFSSSSEIKFKMYKHFFKGAIRMDEFELADKILTEIYDSSYYRYFEKDDKNYWFIALLSFVNLSQLKGYKISTNLKKRRSFISRVTLDYFDYDKQYHGYSICLLLHYALHYLINEDKQEMLKLESLIRATVLRFNLKPSYQRALIFLNLVLNVIVKDFNWKVATRINSKHNSKYKLYVDFDDLEFYDNEKFWELISKKAEI